MSAIDKESTTQPPSRYLRPTGDNVTDNCERRADLPRCMRRDEGLERGSFREWSTQLKPVRVPKSIARGAGRGQAVHLHLFADASNVATITVIESTAGVVQGLLTSKSRILKRATSTAKL